MNEPPRVVTPGEACHAQLALSPESVKAFATLVNDMNPLHHDEAYAAASRFGGLIASGTQPSAHFMALLATHFSRYAQPLGLDFEIKMKRAVRASDTLTFSWRVTDAWWKPSLNGDIVKLAGTVTNQQGDTLIVSNATILVMPQPAPDAAVGAKTAENTGETGQTGGTARTLDERQAAQRSAQQHVRLDAQEVRAQDARARNAQRQSAQAQSVQTQGVQTQSARAQDAQNAQMQGARVQEDAQTQSVRTQNARTQEAQETQSAQNAQTQNARTQEAQEQGPQNGQHGQPARSQTATRALNKTPVTLPASIHVFERGWLSSNSVLLVDDARAALVDTGYATHGAQTVARVRDALGARALDLIVNTHLHSDHCGGNAPLQVAWPGEALQTLIPATCASIVRDWDESRLTFRATGQTCARFGFTGTLAPGVRLALGGLDWQALAAPGHDPDALMLYSADARLLISADALWENGFGVIFPELEGASGFAEQQATLERIASLDIDVVIPGHGAPFANVAAALERAFARLAWLRADPARNAKNALKVLVTFKLLEVRAMRFAQLLALLEQASIMRAVATTLAPRAAWPALVRRLAEELAKNGVLRVEEEGVVALMSA